MITFIKKAMLSIWLFFVHLFLFGQEKDTVYLFNNQVLVGDIKSAQTGAMIIDDVDLKDIQVKMYKIRALHSSTRFKVVIKSMIYYGFFRKSDQDGWVDLVLDDGQVIKTPILEISQLLAIEKEFLTRLNGSLAAGFSYTKSNAQGQVNLSTSIRYAGERFTHQISLSTIGAIDSSDYSRDRENGDLFSAFTIDVNWFICAGISYQRNLELSIARRYQELLGGGKKLLSRKDLEVLAITGLTFNQEKSTSGASEGLLLEIPLIFKLDYFKYHHPNIQISSTNSLFYSLTQKNRFRYGGNVNISWEMVRHFYVTINPYANFDNQPPQGNSNFDFGLSLNLSFQF